MTMPRLLPVLLAALFVAAPALAAADPDLVLVTVEDAPVALEEVEAILRGELPGLRISTEATEAVGAARVVIAAAADGRLAISYRDAAGRETVRLVEPGPRPASTVAMIVVNLQQDQLDAVLGSEAPTAWRLEEPRRAEPRVQAVVSPSGAPHVVASLGAGLGLMNRHLEVGISGGADDRIYQVSYPLLTADAAVYPARLFDETGFLSWIGLELTFRRSLSVQTSGTTSAGDAVEVDSSYQDVGANLLVDLPLSARPDGARVRLSTGWSRVIFALDAAQMAMLDESQWTPTFDYDGFALAGGIDLPLGDGGLRAEGAIALHWVGDVGQEVRDLYGSDTTGALGYRAQAGLAGSLVRRLGWSAIFEIRELTTHLSGATASLGGRLGAFSTASDRYLALRAGLAYTP